MKNFLQRFISSDIVKTASIKPYLFFLLSVIFSQIAFNMMNVTLIFLMFFLTGSNFLVSLILFISLIPQVLLSFFGGIFADKHDKKTILIWVNVIRAVIIGILFFITDSPLVVYLIALTVSVATQFYIPAEAPVIPKLVPEKFLIPANSLFGLSLFGSTLIGFIMAGPAITLLGRSSAFLVIVLFFILAGFFAKLIPTNLIREQVVIHKKTSGAFFASLLLSYAMLRDTKNVISSFILLTISQVVIFILAVIIPGFTANVLKLPAESVSLLLFAPAGFGMIFAAILIGTIFEKTNRDILMTIGVFISGVVLFLFPIFPLILSLFPESIRPNITTILISTAFLAGIGNASIFIPAQATIQEKIPEHFRSKIYGLLFSIIGFFSLIPLITVGGLADVIGVNTVLYIVSLVILLSGVFQLLILRKL